MCRLACKCGEEAKRQGYDGFSMRYQGQCFGKTKSQLDLLLKDEHQNSKCYGEQIYVDCLKEEHNYCMGKEEAEAVYQFESSAVKGKKSR